MTWQQHVRKCKAEHSTAYKCKTCGWESDGRRPLQEFEEKDNRSMLSGGQLKNFQNHMAANHGIRAVAMINEFNALFEGE